MITIGQKNKILLFDVSTDNMDSKDLEFWFRIYCEEVTYSFKGELVENNKVKITILPLAEMVRPKYLDFHKVYRANLEVIGEGKYSITTWDGDIQFETPPRIDVKLENVQDESKPIIREESNKKERITDVKKDPKNFEVKVSNLIEEDTETLQKDKKNHPRSKDVTSTRTSLLEDILKHPDQKQTVITKINNLIKE